MALFNYTSREINAKIVYYGPGLSGKTTNIQQIFEKIAPDKKGKLITLPTYTDRTLFFDFFPLEAGEIKGYKMRFHLYTVPGQVFYNATRRLVLKGADGVVFVADSQEGMMDSNLESMGNLRKNLGDLGLDLDAFPFVIQYNKRDLPGVLPVDVLNRSLNPKNVPFFAASAATGEGVLDTLTAVSRLVLKDLKENIETGQPRRRPVSPTPGMVEDIAAPSPGSSAQSIGVKEKTEDVSRWVREDFGGETAARELPPVQAQEHILDAAMTIKLRLVTSMDGDRLIVHRVEVAGFEPRDIKIVKK